MVDIGYCSNGDRNRGIGYEIVHRSLANGIHVISTDPDLQMGRASLKILHNVGFDNAIFYQLDVKDDRGIHVFAKWMKQ
ncbi:hypothetical protein SUGI_1067070 [Cryptomeria japonica]|nr:hypothetical protein SUGI_1067070 [Cryptomeria japonica]